MNAELDHNPENGTQTNTKDIKEYYCLFIPETFVSFVAFAVNFSIIQLLYNINEPAMHIQIDYREHKSGIYHIFQKFNKIKATYVDLEIGDYLIEDQLIFERKTLLDFVSSIKDGRLFRQACKLINGKSRPVMILEGRVEELKESNMKREAIQGAIINLAVILGIPILRSKSPEESARLMIYAGRQVDRIARGPVLRSGKRPKGKKAKQLMLLQALPGVGPKRAVRLLEHFGSFEAVVSSNVKEMSQLDGIGEHIATEIYSVLHEPMEWYGE